MTQPLAMIDGRLGQRLHNFYPDRATVRRAVITRDGSGAEVLTYSEVLYADVPCRIRPVSGGEVEDIDQTFTRTTHRIAFQNPQAGIGTEDRATIAGQDYDLILVQLDSAGHATYLDVEVVT